MSIDAVVRRRDFSVGKPGPFLVRDAARQGLGRPRQGARRALVPVELRRVVRPEPFRVLQRCFVDHVLEVRWHSLYIDICVGCGYATAGVVP